MKEIYKHIDIVGKDGKPISNTLISTGKTDKVALIFPGFGYTCQMPLLYYTSLLLLENKYDVLWVEYEYKNTKFENLTSSQKLLRLEFDAHASYKAVLSNNNYKKVFLVGKSLGTFALLNLKQHQQKIEKTLWLTPILGKSRTLGINVYEKISHSCSDSMLIIGKADPYYSKVKILELRKKGAQTLSVNKADHSLEITGNMGKSLETLTYVLDKIDSYIKK